jgi:hypothetical protein
MRHKPSPALVVSLLALIVAMGGTSYAAIKLPKNSVGAAQLKKNAVTSAKVKNGSLLKSDFKSGQLPAGPQGLQGPAGPAGAPGKNGANAATSVTFADSAGKTVADGANSADSTDTVACAAGAKATGGGVIVTDTDGNVLTTVPVTLSDSTTDAGDQTTGWEGAIDNETGGDVVLIVEAICASP